MYRPPAIHASQGLVAVVVLAALGAGCAALGGRYAFPDGFVCPPITSDFGSYTNPGGSPRTSGPIPHNGIDIEADISTPVLAAADGVVTWARNSGHMGGNEVTLLHDGEDGKGRHIRSSYSHLDAYHVVVGQQVRRGEQIGTLGRSGLHSALPAHLHFTVWSSSAAGPEWLDTHIFWLRRDAGERVIIPPFVPGTVYPSSTFGLTYPVPCHVRR